MSELRSQTDIDRPVEDVWAVIGDFGGLASWMPTVISCQVAADVRLVKTANATVTEKLVSRDSKTRTISYSVIDGIPVESHTASISVFAAENGSFVVWTVQASPEAVAFGLSRMYDRCLAALKGHMESQA